MDKKNTTNSNKITLIIVVAIILIITVIFISRLGYARYTHNHNASATVKVATVACEMTVTSCESSDTIINPYCTIDVKNYENDKIAETDLNFTIEVTPKGDFTLPEYYWKDSSGTILARSTALTGTFTKGVKEDKEYTIVFLNSGETDITRKVDFNLVAVQAEE